MRIIGGQLRGRQICPPAGYEARPTTDFAKEALFNIIDNEYEFDGLSVLDLFGGTGSISYEFASRGASRIICIENLSANAAFIKAEVRRLGIDDRVTVVRRDAMEFLNGCTDKFDIIFADPPYAMEGIEGIPEKATRLLSDIGLFVLEHSAAHSFEGYPLYKKERKYGNVHFSFFYKE